MEAFLTSTLLVAVAEVGDKTQLLSFVLAARLRKPWPILGGVLAATLLNHALAGWAGALLAHVVAADVLAWIVGLSFIAFGIWALKPDSLGETPRIHRAGAFATAFAAFFVAEMGDKTQLATVALAARFEALATVIVGTTLGMMIANIPAVWIGDRLAQRMPMRAVQALASVLFVAVGMLTLAGTLAANGQRGTIQREPPVRALRSQLSLRILRPRRQLPVRGRFPEYPQGVRARLCPDCLRQEIGSRAAT